MRVSQTPVRSEDLALLRRLADYGDGRATWRSNEQLGEAERADCRRLHAALVDVVNRMLGPLLDRVNAREMKTFTMHDSLHGLKVAHLMWHILSEERRARLTPPEIAILVLAAHLHDLGMGVSAEERAERLRPDSDLWQKVDAIGGYERVLTALKAAVTSGRLSSSDLAAAADQVAEAEDALLCVDARERHATAARYAELLSTFKAMHLKAGGQVPSIEAAMRFGDDTFESRLIDVCVSHNEDASCLLEARPDNRQEYRFPPAYPVGTAQADLRMAAATLRLADILDFDRERVPAVLYHYLLPRSARPAENISVREWQKHMAISNWDFDSSCITFRGRTTNAVAHHAVIEFCRVIEDEIKRTRAALGATTWPFAIGERVVADLHAEGFSYLPYRFKLQEEKIFGLLMGRGIYRERLDAVRELLQNAVDSCQLRDALVRAHQPSVVPSTDDRIVITYQDGAEDGGLAMLSIRDSGTGMDRWLIENYFLKVGESYYKSSDFLRSNAVLWRRGVGFSPVSEFGIGFVSVFMLSNRIEVETAMPHSPRKDTARRILDIDGLGRLISVTEFDNAGFAASEGTTVTLRLDDAGLDTTWESLRKYLQRICVDLPYSLVLVHNDRAGEPLSREQIHPRAVPMTLMEDLEKAAFRIKVGGPDRPIEGEIVLFGLEGMTAHQEKEIAEQRFRTGEAGLTTYSRAPASVLSRGGFSLGEISSLPRYIGFKTAATGLVRLRAKGRIKALPQTNLARTHLREDSDAIDAAVFQAWLEPLIADPRKITDIGLGVLDVSAAKRRLQEAKWLENYSAMDLYGAARLLWIRDLGENGKELVETWENGASRTRLRLGTFADYLHRAALQLVLPNVSTLCMAEHGAMYVAPPVSGWQKLLAGERAFPLNKPEWDHFADYMAPIDRLLYYQYPSTQWLSLAYRDRLVGFSADELTTLMQCLGRLIDAKSHSYLASPTQIEVKILSRLGSLFPDARVGSSNCSARLADFLPA